MKHTLIIMACVLLLLAGCATKPSYTVMTQPPGADIFVDGKLVGKTPATINVVFTENVQMVTEKKILTVKLQGYKTKKELLSPGGERHTALNLTLVPESNDRAASEITSNPTTTTGQTTQSAMKGGLISDPSSTGGQ